jgi:hypothetical protein
MDILVDHISSGLMPANKPTISVYIQCSIVHRGAQREDACPLDLPVLLTFSPRRKPRDRRDGDRGRASRGKVAKGGSGWSGDIDSASRQCVATTREARKACRISRSIWRRSMSRRAMPVWPVAGAGTTAGSNHSIDSNKINKKINKKSLRVTILKRGLKWIGTLREQLKP